MWPNLFKRRQYKTVRVWKDGDFYVLFRDGWFQPWKYLACVDTRGEAKTCVKFHKRMSEK
jgi:hypothetical protein